MKLSPLLLLALVAAGCGSHPPSGPPTAAPPNPHMTVPAVLVIAPKPGATVQRRFTVSGTASIPTVTIELVRHGRALTKETVRATSHGTFAAMLDASPGLLTLEARGAGTKVEVPLIVSP